MTEWWELRSSGSPTLKRVEVVSSLYPGTQSGQALFRSFNRFGRAPSASAGGRLQEGFQGKCLWLFDTYFSRLLEPKVPT